MAQVEKTDSVEDDLERILLAFENLRGEGLTAIFAKVKLDGFVFGLAAAALDDLAACAIGAALDLAVEELATAGPGNVVGGFKFLRIGFD